MAHYHHNPKIQRRTYLGRVVMLFLITPRKKNNCFSRLSMIPYNSVKRKEAKEDVVRNEEEKKRVRKTKTHDRKPLVSPIIVL
jgi:hypothetical protein